MLEPCDGKLSRTVLRGEGSHKAPALPGIHGKICLFLALGNDNLICSTNTSCRMAHGSVTGEIEKNE